MKEINDLRINKVPESNHISDSLGEEKRRPLPSKSVRERKRKSHRLRLNKMRQEHIDSALDRKRIITDSLLSDVLDECRQIVEANTIAPEHSDECSYYMNCRGEPCRCSKIETKPIDIDVSELADIVDDIVEEVLPLEAVQDGQLVANRIDVRTTFTHLASVMVYCKTIKCHERVGVADSGELKKVNGILDLIPYVPIGIQLYMDKVGIFSQGDTIYYPRYTPRFLQIRDGRVMRTYCPKSAICQHRINCDWIDLDLLQSWYIYSISDLIGRSPKLFCGLELNLFARTIDANMYLLNVSDDSDRVTVARTETLSLSRLRRWSNKYCQMRDDTSLRTL